MDDCTGTFSELYAFDAQRQGATKMRTLQFDQLKKKFCDEICLYKYRELLQATPLDMIFFGLCTDVWLDTAKREAHRSFETSNPFTKKSGRNIDRQIYGTHPRPRKPASVELTQERCSSGTLDRCQRPGLAPVHFDLCHWCLCQRTSFLSCRGNRIIRRPGGDRGKPHK